VSSLVPFHQLLHFEASTLRVEGWTKTVCTMAMRRWRRNGELCFKYFLKSPSPPLFGSIWELCWAVRIAVHLDAVKKNTVSALFRPVKRGTGSIFQALVAPFARVKADIGHLMPSGHISMMYPLFPVVYSNFFAGYFEGLSICTINVYIYIHM